MEGKLYPELVSYIILCDRWIAEREAADAKEAEQKAKKKSKRR
jgi:hypothetical protein